MLFGFWLAVRATLQTPVVQKVWALMAPALPAGYMWIHRRIHTNNGINLIVRETRVLLHSSSAADPDHLWCGFVGAKKAACCWGDLGWPSGSGATGTGASCAEPTTPPVVRPSSSPWIVLHEGAARDALLVQHSLAWRLRNWEQRRTEWW